MDELVVLPVKWLTGVEYISIPRELINPLRDAKRVDKNKSPASCFFIAFISEKVIIGILYHFLTFVVI